MDNESTIHRQSRNFQNLIGKIFGRLHVLDINIIKSNNNKGLKYWDCFCECGKKVIVSTSDLNNGRTNSCGCLKREQVSKRFFKHGEANKTSEYCSYQTARSRCNNFNNSRYADYGGRGIKFLYTSYKQFLNDLGRKPTSIHSLNRIDNNGNYTIGNCEWATPIKQANNKRNNHLITFDGKTLTVAQWARDVGLTYATLSSRLDAGMPIDRCLTMCQKYNGIRKHKLN